MQAYNLGAATFVEKFDRDFHLATKCWILTFDFVDFYREVFLAEQVAFVAVLFTGSKSFWLEYKCHASRYCVSPHHRRCFGHLADFTFLLCESPEQQTFNGLLSDRKCCVSQLGRKHFRRLWSYRGFGS